MFTEFDYTEPATPSPAVLRGIASAVFGLLVRRPAYTTCCERHGTLAQGGGASAVP
jgi:hypothetical protein